MLSTVALVVFRASEVVGMPLVPARFHQFWDAVFRTLHLVALLNSRVARLDVVIDDELYLVGIELQPRAHVLGDIVGVEGALIHIAKNRFYSVVARDDNIAAIVTCIEDIVVLLLLVC